MQATHVIALPPVRASGDERFVFFAGVWSPSNLAESRDIWRPISWADGKPLLRWRNRWTLSDGWAEG